MPDASVAVRLAATGRWQVRVAAPEKGAFTESEHLYGLLGRAPGVALVPPDKQPDADVLFARLGVGYPVPTRVARVVGIVGDEFAGPRAAVSILRRTVRQARRCDAILAESRGLFWNPFRGWKRVVRFEPSVHPDFWLRAELAKRISEPPPAGQRSVRLMFAGSITPEARLRVLREVEAALAGLPAAQVFWRVYGSGVPAEPLSQTAYLDALDAADFVLAPPGWLPWTHRLAEAASRQTVPIVDEREGRAFGLQDGVSAVLVHGDWAGAVRRALEMPREGLRKMRQALAGLTVERLTPAAAAARLCRQLRI